ncbi:MAG: fimbrillin family protein, partial [Prevotella sp.]|nr:fimbrillin family protein [Prevotella sp.]
MIEKRRNFVFRFLPGLFLSGLLLLSGCSQDDVSDVSAGSRAIDFRAQGGMSALKATTTGSEYIRSFAVNAHYGAYNAAGKFLMEGVTVYRGEGGGSSWTYSPQAYFPTTDEGDVDFFAYSPSGSKYVERSLKDAAVANDADQKITYVVPAPNGSATSQEDLLVARQTVAYNSGNSAYPGTAVGLQFHHALSRILVAASSSLGKEVPVAITKLELKNLYSKGDLSLSSLEIPVAEGWGYTNGVAGDKVLWTNYTGSTLASYAYSLPKSGVYVGETSATVTGDDQGIFVLPQTTKGNPGDGSPEAGVTDDGEFGLKVSYSINGSPDRDAY